MIRALLACLTLVALAVGAVVMWERLDQPVRVVRVEGTLTPAEQAAIQGVCRDVLVDGVLSVDLEELTARINALSWPRDVRVRRIWPNGLLIQVEREPLVAAWGNDAFLTSAGKVVHLTGYQEAALPVLSAELSTPRQTMQVFQVLQDQLQPSGLVIRALSENLLGEWLLTLDNGLTVALGNQKLTERLQRFLLLYHRVLAERMPEPAYVDTRYENGIAVRRDAAMLALAPAAGKSTQPTLDSEMRNGL